MKYGAIRVRGAEGPAVACGAQGAGQGVIVVGLMPVGRAWLAQFIGAVRAGSVLVQAPGDGVGDGLRHQLCLRVHRREAAGHERGDGLLQAADEEAWVVLQVGKIIGPGLVRQRRDLGPPPVQER
jgi:hypothetical protein